MIRSSSLSSLIDSMRLERTPNEPRGRDIFDRHTNRLEDDALIAGNIRRGWIRKYLSDFSLHLRARKNHIAGFPLDT